VQGVVKRRLASPNKQAATPQYVKITPSRRVASKNSVCGVANLDNGITIVRDSRLAAIFFCWQRISRKKSYRLLGERETGMAGFINKGRHICHAR
jgi:hypothetical protein